MKKTISGLPARNGRGYGGDEGAERGQGATGMGGGRLVGETGHLRRLRVADARALNLRKWKLRGASLGSPRRKDEPWLGLYQRAMRLARAVVWKFMGGQLSDQAWMMHWRWAGHVARYSNWYAPRIATFWFDYATF